MCGPRGLPLGNNVLYRNQRDGTFADVSEPAGILKPGGRYGLGVVASDFDNDGWTDIYVACDQTPSLFFRNRGNGAFEERGIQAGVAYNFDGHAQAGMGVAVADYDGNGFFDIVKTNFSGDLPSLYNNEDGKFFSDLSKQAGLAANQLLGWGVLFLDADEDGRKDILMANGHVYPEVDAAATGDRYLQKTLALPQPWEWTLFRYQRCVGSSVQIVATRSRHGFRRSGRRWTSGSGHREHE